MSNVLLHTFSINRILTSCDMLFFRDQRIVNALNQVAKILTPISFLINAAEPHIQETRFMKLFQTERRCLKG